MKTIEKTVIILLIISGIISCRTEKEPKDDLIGNYKLEKVTIDGENVTALLMNDSIHFTSMLISGELSYYSFNIYIDEIDNAKYIYVATYQINGLILKVKKRYWDSTPEYFLNTNEAIYPFSLQDTVIFHTNKPSSNQLHLSTVFSGKDYTYEFRK